MERYFEVINNYPKLPFEKEVLIIEKEDIRMENSEEVVYLWDGNEHRRIVIGEFNEVTDIYKNMVPIDRRYENTGEFLFEKNPVINKMVLIYFSHEEGLPIYSFYELEVETIKEAIDFLKNNGIKCK